MHRQQHPRDGHEPLGHVDVVDLAQHGAGEGEGGRGQEAGHGRELQGPQEGVHADSDGSEEDDLGGDPGGAVGQEHEEHRDGVEGAGVEVGQQRRAAEDVLVPERQLPMPQHGAHQHMKGVVLLQVVAGQQQVAPEEVGQDEGRRRDGGQHEVGPEGAYIPSNSVH
jgi:hypothetical protein